MRWLFLGSAVLATVLVALSLAVGLPRPASAQAGAPATGNIEVRDGVNPGEAIISWDAVPQATHYRIGYVNMVQDYPLAKASVTGEWIEAFVYVDVNARNSRSPAAGWSTRCDGSPRATGTPLRC